MTHAWTALFAMCPAQPRNKAKKFACVMNAIPHPLRAPDPQMFTFDLILVIYSVRERHLLAIYYLIC